MDPYATQLAKALCRVVIDAGIIPSTTLSATSAVGDQSLTLTDPTFIENDSVFSFWDGTGERSLAIDSEYVTGTNPVTLSFAGKQSGPQAQGLQYPHAIGAKVATNIFRTPLGDNAAAFDNGYPVVGCFCIDNTLVTSNETNRYQNRAMLSMDYRLPAMQSTRMDAQIWIEQQLDRGEADADLIVQQLKTNTTLKVDGISNCFLIEKFIESRRHNVSDPDNPVFQFLLDFQVAGTFVNIR